MSLERMGKVIKVLEDMGIFPSYLTRAELKTTAEYLLELEQLLVTESLSTVPEIDDDGDILEEEEESEDE